MERIERQRLEAIRRHLKRDLATVDQLLATAAKPKRLSSADIKERAAKICQDIRSHGGVVSRDVLKVLVNKYGFPFTAVGALFSSGYLATKGKNIGLGTRGLTIVGRATTRRRRKK